MKLLIDTAARTLTRTEEGRETSIPLYSKEAFEAISAQWVRIGWSLRYYHNFSWFGQPILQLPEDLVRLQEVIWRVRPTLIVETGIFKGGSLLFSASLLEALGGGRVVGVDLEVPAHVRGAVANHPLGHRITILEGDSTSPEIVGHIGGLIKPGDVVLIVLDSCHTKDHVARELSCYAPFVSPGSYIVATDGIMRDLTDVPGGLEEWKEDNPAAAAAEFAEQHPEFQIEQPAWLSHDGELTENVTYWPGAWLRRTTT